ncbi:MAG TPA: hypothetical protein VMO26_17385 [Vicinamibacterales bacterium]|nr:hypothetical protein [Vicinamibacterales bacterium]
MKRILIRVLMIVAALAVIGFLFMRSVQSTRSAPYTIEQAHLQDWTFAIEPGNAPNAVLIAARPPRELASALFRQLFSRLAESMNGPTSPMVPLLLQDEFNRSFAGRATTGELLAAARDAGVEAAAFEPRCMGYRRESAPGVTRQLYFVFFEAPAFTRFRQQIAALAEPGTGYDPTALSPVMPTAASDPDFNRWLPLRVNPDTDCVAPIVIESVR